MRELPASAARFRDAAARLGLQVEIVVTAQPARSAEDAAATCGCELGQIVKSLVFRGSETGVALLFLVSGRHRVDERRAAAAAGEPILRADPAFVRQATGFAIGGVPPLGHDTPARTFIDEALLAYPAVWAAAGTPNTVFAVAPDRLREVTGAVPVSLGRAAG